MSERNRRASAATSPSGTSGKRYPQAGSPPPPGAPLAQPVASASHLWTRRLTYTLTVFLRWFSSHWLLLANLAVGLYLGLPILAPVLQHAGHPGAANLIHIIFRLLCHQLPERSFFLYGERWAYSYEQLGQMLGGLVPQRYMGEQGIGFKMAVCQRCMGIYLAMLLAGLAFVWLRRRLRPLSFKLFGLMMVPVGIDGLGQLLGLWTSPWWSRVITGGLFGLACAWLAYPYLERGMEEVHQEAARTLKEWGK